MTKKKDINTNSDMVRQGLDLGHEAQKLFDYKCPKCNEDIKVHAGSNKCSSCGYVFEYVVEAK